MLGAFLRDRFCDLLCMFLRNPHPPVSHVVAVFKKVDDAGDSKEHGEILTRFDTAALLHLLPHHHSVKMG